MRKLLIVFALLGIVMISGCTSSQSGIVNGEGTANGAADAGSEITYYEATCRQDTDCMLSHCRGYDEEHCMNTVQLLRDMRCEGTGNLISEKNYEACGCVEGICQAK